MWMGERVWPKSDMQTCIWPSWCHCHSLSLASVKSRLVLPLWYRHPGSPGQRAVKWVCVCDNDNNNNNNRHDTLPVDLPDLWPSDILILAFVVFNPGEVKIPEVLKNYYINLLIFIINFYTPGSKDPRSKKTKIKMSDGWMSVRSTGRVIVDTTVYFTRIAIIDNHCGPVCPIIYKYLYVT